MSGTAVVLFTRDLRVHDQRAHRAAADRGGTVVPLFALDAFRRPGGANRRLFLRDALADLRESLRRLGGDLVVRLVAPVAPPARAGVRLRVRARAGAAGGSLRLIAR